MLPSVSSPRLFTEDKMTENKDTGDKSPTDGQEYVKTYGKTANDDYGFYFYPNRNPGKIAEEKPGFLSSLKTAGLWGLWSHDPKNNVNCRMLVRQCVERNKRVQMMMRALKTHGCPVDLDRHIHCEPCKLKISGGFDFFTNQVVVCENNIKKEAPCCNVLSHEMLHAFDKCRAKFDINNVEHLACTEIRAANLFHCSLTSAYVNGEAKPWNIKERHMNCVKRKALTSVLLVRNITPEEADKVIDKVFSRCYNDLEPFGRRLRLWARDEERSLSEGILYGYLEP
ncbi:mitochondrial inner membrane protease ATP23 homolog [Mercenaria mercenaria]|uniref:mitochondrial inner membrane protease ATP23 homolog n=1 Tax=Mercenaria mercenaria TaxID=6596 RepID=UPI001E1DA49F|nr:mitochondrial inner membrane protease ATP23 homolog [Mercenaria mercenaria]